MLRRKKRITVDGKYLQKIMVLLALQEVYILYQIVNRKKKNIELKNKIRFSFTQVETNPNPHPVNYPNRRDGKENTRLL